MTDATYKYAGELSWGGDTPTAEVEITCSFGVAWGSPEAGRFGPIEAYDPGCNDQIQNVKILTVDGKPWPVDLSYGFQTPAQDHEMLVDKLLSDHEDDMLAEARDDQAARDEEARERAEEARREVW